MVPVTPLAELLSARKVKLRVPHVNVQVSTRSLASPLVTKHTMVGLTNVYVIA